MVHRTIMPKPDLENTTSINNFEAERERLHRQMLSSVSHDLKTPLASIIGSLEVFERMKDKLPPEKKAELIRVALQESYRLDNFITNILDMARLESGMVKVKRESTAVETLIRDCLTRLSNRLNGSTVTVQLADSVQAMTDSVLLSRTICLILDNAVKYGGSPPTIHVEYGTEGDQFAFIKISDNGQGIPSSQLEAIFSKYARFPKEDQQTAGTGLGLSISRTIMTLLDGTITVVNQPSNGALFTLRFPIR